MKRAVIFDVGGVLFAPPQRAIAAYEKELELPKGAVAYVFAHGAPHNAFCRLERGELTLSQFFPEFEKECQEVMGSRGLTFPRGFSARELFQKMAAIELIPEMIGAVKSIKAAGYCVASFPGRVGGEKTSSLLPRGLGTRLVTVEIKLHHGGFKTCALTNNWVDDTSNHEDKLDGFLLTDYFDYFDLVLQSCKLGMRKPDPRIYQLACEQLQVKPDQAVFLDDIGSNLKPARRLGITTIHVRDPTEALQELEKVLGISLLSSEEQRTATSSGSSCALKSKL